MKPTFSEVMKALGRFIKEIPIEIVSFIVAPFLYFFVDKSTGYLPKYLSWFDEPNYGAWGDYGWKKDHFQEPKNKSWWAVTRWYWRNRINGYQISVNGLDTSKIVSIETIGNPQATITLNTSCLVRVKTEDGKEYFSYFMTKTWCKYFYFRIYIGHKLMYIAGKNTVPENDKVVVESVFSIHPFRKISSFLYNIK